METNYFDLNLDYSKVSYKHFLIGLINRFDNRYQVAADDFFRKISWTQLFCLKGISLFKYPPTIRDIADFLGCSHQNAAQLLRKLCKAGYVTLKVDECDRRKQRLFLTEKAEAFLNEHADAAYEAIDDIFGGITEEEIFTAIDIMKKLNEKLNKYEKGEKMLKLKDLIENYDLAKEILSNWEYDSDTLDDCLEYFRISSNAVYPFRQNGRLCFLRFAPTNEKLYTNICGEIEFILYLRTKGYPALEPLKAKNGEYILTLATAWGEYYATAFYSVDGESIEDTDFNGDICFEYGKALGALHKLSSEFKPCTKKETYMDILNLIEKRLQDFNCDAVLFDRLASLRKEMLDLPMDTEHYGLVHYDFECDNVFYDEDKNICSVIDFDDGIYHFYAVDIEQALDSIAEEAPDDLYENAKKAFLEGYKTEYYFDLATEAMLPTMRKFCDMYSYTKLLYCLSDSVSEEPDWMVELKAKLTNKAEYLFRVICEKHD